SGPRSCWRRCSTTSARSTARRTTRRRGSGGPGPASGGGVCPPPAPRPSRSSRASTARSRPSPRRVTPPTRGWRRSCSTPSGTVPSPSSSSPCSPRPARARRVRSRGRRGAHGSWASSSPGAGSGCGTRRRCRQVPWSSDRTQRARGTPLFASLSDRLTATFRNLRGKGRLSEQDITTTVSEIRRALLEADVALPVVREFTAAVRERALGAEVSGALNPGQQVVKIVNSELVEILGGQARDLRFAKRPPTVIMLAGLQGAGKTTLAGKLAKWLKDQGQTPLLVASDLQRPNAVTQLQVVGERAGVPVWAPEPGNGVGDPIEVARSGLAHAQDKLYSVVIVDTAGRLGVDTEMMAQAAAIKDVVQPDETLFVLDAMIGQDAVATAQAFQEGVDFTGVVLTKLD